MSKRPSLHGVPMHLPATSRRASLATDILIGLESTSRVSAMSSSGGSRRISGGSTMNTSEYSFRPNRHSIPREMDENVLYKEDSSISHQPYQFSEISGDSSTINDKTDPHEPTTPTTASQVAHGLEEKYVHSNMSLYRATSSISNQNSDGHRDGPNQSLLYNNNVNSSVFSQASKTSCFSNRLTIGSNYNPYGRQSNASGICKQNSAIRSSAMSMRNQSLKPSLGPSSTSIKNFSKIVANKPSIDQGTNRRPSLDQAIKNARRRSLSIQKGVDVLTPIHSTINSVDHSRATGLSHMSSGPQSQADEKTGGCFSGLKKKLLAVCTAN